MKKVLATFIILSVSLLIINVLAYNVLINVSNQQESKYTVVCDPDTQQTYLYDYPNNDIVYAIK